MNQGGCEKLLRAVLGNSERGFYPSVIDENGGQLTLPRAMEGVFQDPSFHRAFEQEPMWPWDRYRRLLELRFGLLDGKAYTLEGVAGELHVTRERIRQKETIALRRLRRHQASQILRQFLILSLEELEAGKQL